MQEQWLEMVQAICVVACGIDITLCLCLRALFVSSLSSQVEKWGKYKKGIPVDAGCEVCTVVHSKSFTHNEQGKPATFIEVCQRMASEAAFRSSFAICRQIETGKRKRGFNDMTVGATERHIIRVRQCFLCLKDDQFKQMVGCEPADVDVRLRRSRIARTRLARLFSSCHIRVDL